MPIALLFLLALLTALVVMNWRFLSGAFGIGGRPCDWSRLHSRDRNGQNAWFCPACGHEEFVTGKGPPTDCGAADDGRQRVRY
ncbi:MAG TPA: hypothetical protein VMY41_04460 [Thermohalobaculum sp.]|nr:hypothetical protein [Thermohalobaculum sp.]